MKKTLIYILLLCVIIISCKKEKQPGGGIVAGVKYPVVYNVSGFTSTILPITNNTKKTLDDTASATLPFIYLYYQLYNSSNVLVHTIIQSSRAPNLGHFNDTVSAGQYSVVITGSNVALTFPTDTNFYTTVSNTSYPTTGDLFFLKYPLTVSGSIPVQNVVLNRLEAQLEVVLQDTIPSNGAVIAISYPDMNYFSILKNAQPYFGNSSVTGGVIPTLAPSGAVNYTLDSYVNNTVSPVTITITAGNITRIIPNIQFKRNTKTILTGKLFTGAVSSFNITYNTAFTDTIRMGI